MKEPGRPAPVTGVDFRPGTVALRIRRGQTHFLIPRTWVRAVSAVGQVVPLPHVKPWVLGIAVHDQRPVPLLDAAVIAGQAAEAPKAAVLIGRSNSTGLAFIATDAPGRFVSIPAAAHLESSEAWLRRVHGCPGSMWWLDADRLTNDLKS